MYKQNLPCPNCNHNISFDVNALLQGVSFACSICMATIQLSNESKEIVTESMKEFNEIRSNVLNKQK